MDVAASRHIEAPPNQVSQIMFDPRRDPEWIGGLYGATSVAVAAYAAPRIGLVSLITIGVAGQIAMALWLDHWGALGLPREPINLGRILGALLVVAGVVIVRRS